MTKEKNRSFLCCGLHTTGRIVVLVDFVLTILALVALFYFLRVFEENKSMVREQIIRLRNTSRGSLLNEQKKILEDNKFLYENIINGICCGIFFAGLHLLFCLFFLCGISKVKVCENCEFIYFSEFYSDEPPIHLAVRHHIRNHSSIVHARVVYSSQCHCGCCREDLHFLRRHSCGDVRVPRWTRRL